MFGVGVTGAERSSAGALVRHALRCSTMQRWGDKVPFKTRPWLAQKCLGFLEASLEVATQATYQSGLSSYEKFYKTAGIPIAEAYPITEELLVAYLAAAATNLQLTYKTIKVYFYGLKHWSMIYGLGTKGFEAPIIKKALLAARKVAKKPPEKVRMPLTLPLLEKVMESMKRKGGVPWAWRTKLALIAFGFQSGTRPSVYAVRKVHGVQICDTLTWKDIEFQGDRIVVTIARSKTDPFRKGRKVIIFNNNMHTNAFKYLHDLKTLQGFYGRALGSSPVFQNFPSGSPFTYAQLQTTVKEEVARAGITTVGSISSYSLRRGFVTSAFLAGVPMEGVKALCGHKSDAYRCYIHVTMEMKAAYSRDLYKPRSQIYGWLNQQELLSMSVDSMEEFFKGKRAQHNRWR